MIDAHKVIFVDLVGNVIDSEEGQADGGVLLTQSGSLVYYVSMTNDVFAYFLTGATTLDALIGIDPSDYKVGLNTWSPKWAVSLGFVGEISINVITPQVAALYGYSVPPNEPVLTNDTFRHARPLWPLWQRSFPGGA